MSRSRASGPSLSIVVPAPRDAAALEATLVSVLENRPADCEIVVPLGFAYDDPWGIADEVRLLAAPPGSGLASCANVGIAASAAPVVHVLAAGWLATPGWTDRPRAILDEGDVKAVVPAAIAAADSDAVIAAGVRVTRGGRRVAVVPRRRVDASRIRTGGPLLEAGFWRADVLQAAGPGFAAKCGDWLADADMATAAACLPGRVVFAPESRVVCGPQRRRPGAFTAGLQAERLFWRSLARGGIAAALAAHAMEVVRDVVATAPLGTVPMLAGRAVGLMQFGDAATRYAHLRTARETAEGAATLRIDAPHANVAPPNRVPAEARPLRRSA